MTKIVRVSPVLPVQDVRSAIGWYEANLGFQATFVNDEVGDCVYGLLGAGQLEIHLCKRQLDDDTLRGPANCYFYVDDLRSLHTHLMAQGVDVDELSEMPWGSLECWLHDPDGNRIVLSCPR